MYFIIFFIILLTEYYGRAKLDESLSFIHVIRKDVQTLHLYLNVLTSQDCQIHLKIRRNRRWQWQNFSHWRRQMTEHTLGYHFRVTTLQA